MLEDANWANDVDDFTYAHQIGPDVQLARLDVICLPLLAATFSPKQEKGYPCPGGSGR